VLGLRIFPLPDQVSSRLNIEELHLWVKFCHSVGHRCPLPRSRFPGDPPNRDNHNGSALGPGRLEWHRLTASNMTLAAFTGTPVLDDGKVVTRSFAVGRTFLGEQQAVESIIEKSQTGYVMRVGIMWGKLCHVTHFPVHEGYATPAAARTAPQRAWQAAQSEPVRGWHNAGSGWQPTHSGWPSGHWPADSPDSGAPADSPHTWEWNQGGYSSALADTGTGQQTIQVSSSVAIAMAPDKLAGKGSSMTMTLPVVLGLQIFPLPDQVSSCLNIEEFHLWVKFFQSMGHRCLLPRFRFPGDPQDRYNDNRCEGMHTPVCVGYLCGAADCPGEWLS
jgi:hypothetical protein